MSGKRGTVVLFVKGLPESISRKELKTCFQRSVRNGWKLPLTGRSSIGACDIVRITNRDNNQIEHYGLVEVQPATLALQAIKSLNGSSLQGKNIEVRRYHHRSGFRDRRKDEPLSDTQNRRVLERRRPDLSIELVDWRVSKLIPTLARALQPRSAEKNVSV